MLVNNATIGGNISQGLVLPTPPPPQASTPTFSLPAGSYSSSQSVTISCSTGGSTIYYTTDGSPPTTSSSVYSTAITVSATETIKALATASGFSNSSVASAAYTITSSSITIFPLIAIQASSGAQLPGPSTYNGLAQYSLITLGGSYPSAVGGSKPTRDQILTGLKTQSLTLKNAVRPMVFQYEDLPNTNQNRSTDTFTELTTVTNNNNWWVWVSGSSGSQAVDNGGPYNLRTPCHGGGAGGVAAIAVDSATGLWPYEWAIQAMYNRYITGGGLATSTNFSQMGSAQLDGLWVDNMSGYERISGDWIRNGTTQPSGSSTTSTVAAKLFAGQADVANKFRTLDSTRKIVGNTSWFAIVDYGLDGSPMAGKFDYPMQQFFSGRGIESEYQYRGFAGTMSRYKSIIASSANGSCILTAQYKPGDYQYIRHDICFMLMDNGYMQSALSSGGDIDLADGSDPTTWTVCDEFWGGAQTLGGYLGAPLATAQGAVQTAAWQNGVWRRDFANGIVLINSTQSSQTVNLSGTFYHLRTTTGQAINNASQVTNNITLGTFNYNTANTAFPGGNTIVCGDACILMNNPT